MALANRHQMDKQNLLKIASQFYTDGEICNLSPLGKGLINDNYLIETKNSDGNIRRYVLQRIITNVFKDPVCLQNNLKALTNHIRKTLTDRGEKDIDRKVLTCVGTKDGNDTVSYDGQIWRMTLYITDSVTIENMTPDLARTTGKAFGDFHTMLMTGNPPRLRRQIPISIMSRSDFPNSKTQLGMVTRKE